MLRILFPLPLLFLAFIRNQDLSLLLFLQICLHQELRNFLLLILLHHFYLLRSISFNHYLLLIILSLHHLHLLTFIHLNHLLLLTNLSWTHLQKYHFLTVSKGLFLLNLKFYFILGLVLKRVRHLCQKVLKSVLVGIQWIELR
jgi:hypothetical protein